MEDLAHWVQMDEVEQKDVKVEDQHLQQVKKEEEQQRQHPLEVGQPQPQLDDNEEEPNDGSLDYLHPCLSKLRGSLEKKQALADWLNSPHIKQFMAPDAPKCKDDKTLLKLMTGNMIEFKYDIKKVRDGDKGALTRNVNLLVGDIKVKVDDNVVI